MILLYQWCQGLRRRPYRVFLRSQYSSFAASGSPMGGLTMVILSSGRMPWQNAFLQSPCLVRVRRRSIAMLTSSCIVSGQRTGAYFSGLDQTRSLWLPRTTMRDFARRGLSISSFLMERTHMVGMTLGTPLAQMARYAVPLFSLQKLASHVLRSGWLGCRPERRERGYSRLRFTELTWEADLLRGG